MKNKIHWHFNKFDLLGKSQHDLCHFYILELFDEINEYMDKSNSDIVYLHFPRLSANLSLDSPLWAFEGTKQLRHEKESHFMIQGHLKDRRKKRGLEKFCGAAWWKPCCHGIRKWPGKGSGDERKFFGNSKIFILLRTKADFMSTTLVVLCKT